MSCSKERMLKPGINAAFLKVYIRMNFNGLKDRVVEMIAGNRVRINAGSFTNDMKTFHSSDDKK